MEAELEQPRAKRPGNDVVVGRGRRAPGLEVELGPRGWGYHRGGGVGGLPAADSQSKPSLCTDGRGAERGRSHGPQRHRVEPRPGGRRQGSGPRQEELRFWGPLRAKLQLQLLGRPLYVIAGVHGNGDRPRGVFRKKKPLGAHWSLASGSRPSAPGGMRGWNGGLACVWGPTLPPHTPDRPFALLRHGGLLPRKARGSWN